MLRSLLALLSLHNWTRPRPRWAEMDEAERDRRLGLCAIALVAAIPASVGLVWLVLWLAKVLT